LKQYIYIMLLVLLSCKNKANNKFIEGESQTIVTKKSFSNDTTLLLPKSRNERIKYHTREENVLIYSSDGDTLQYSKEKFNDIVDNFPELFDENTKDPDSTYSDSKISVDLIDSLGNSNRISFGSESGQDAYYLVYAYILKHKNRIRKYSKRRENLLKIYKNLNSLFGQLNYGGTYFVHQYKRIQGYAEFSVYWYSHYQDFFDRSYDIKKQKEYYINGLKQLILDEEKIDNITMGEKEKLKRRNELFQTVSTLNDLITDNFYLRMAKSFQSGNY
jgi:hypothetical protein